MEKLTPLNITRVKSITNKGSETAYLNLKEDEFLLHWPDQRRGNVLQATQNEIIALYQKIDVTKYFTHLVVPIDSIEINEGKIINYRFGRRVKVLACTGEENAIRFDQTKLSEIDFRNRGWGSADNITKIAKTKNIERFQIDLWNKFRPHFKKQLIESDRICAYLSTNFVDEDDLTEDLRAEEGRLRLINHCVRERDRKLVNKKKQIAIRDQKLFCEVCDFSFMGIYMQEYIECHHCVPISEGVRETKLEELELVCSNCHRMLHRRIEGKYLTIKELKRLMNKAMHNNA